MVIPVVHCCGVFGFLLPWDHWMCLPEPIYPVPGSADPHIYIYSVKGQLGHPDRERMVAPRPDRMPMPPCVVGIVCVDDFIDWQSIRLCTDSLAYEITSKWHAYKNSLVPVEPAKPQTPSLGNCANCGKPVHASCSTYQTPDGPLCGNCTNCAKGEPPATTASTKHKHKRKRKRKMKPQDENTRKPKICDD